MKLTTLLLLSALFVQASGSGQTITLSVKNEPLGKVLFAIQKQTTFYFLYSDEDLSRAKAVTFAVKDAPLEDVLKLCFKEQDLAYQISDRMIILKKKGQPVTPNIPSPSALVDVTGKVTDEDGRPVPRATVTLKGTKNSVVTDDKGEFTFGQIEHKSTLVISCVGYESQEMPAKSIASLVVKLKVAANSLDEAIVVAYGTTSQRNNTGSVTVVKGEQIQNLPNRSFDKSLMGLVPGLLVTPGTGQPGGGVSNFVLRGVATNADPANFSTLRNPLIIIDGIPISQETAQIVRRNGSFNYSTAINNPLAQLNPSDIESISVLKDAAAIALYGAKSSNGVILITTKKGKTGKTRFNFRNQTDIATLPNQPDMLNQQEYLNLLYETYKNSPRVVGGVPTGWTDADILADLKTKFPVRSDGSFYPATDWINELYHKTASTISNEISMSGGTDKTNFYLNLEYTKQNGILKKTGYDRKSVRLNFENRPTSWLKMGINTTFSYNIQDYGVSAYGGNASNSGLSVLKISPLNPVRLENGDYYLNFIQAGIATNLPNPAAQVEYNFNRNTAFRGLSKLYAEVSFLRFFKFTTNFGVDYAQTESKEIADQRIVDPGIGKTGGRIEEQSNRRANLITTNILRYNQVFGKNHSLGLIIGQEAQILTQKTLDIAVTGITSPYYDQINSPGATIYSQTGFSTKETLLSYFNQLNYDFKNRYFLTASMRRDGSSRFGEDKRFGTYWSTGIGWLVSSEPFMQHMKSWIDYLKIRGSIGAAGNAGAIDRFTPYTRLQAGRYLSNVAVRPDGSIAGNSDVKWENTDTWDAGIEAKFLQERITITADVYKRTTSNLIYSIPIALTTGYTNILGNLGTMRNEGVELSLSSDIIRSRGFRWNLNANWSTNRNKLVKANTSAAVSQYVTYNQEGQSFNSFYLVRWAGVNPDDGSPQWIDSVGKKNSNYNAAKQEFVGKVQPDGFGAVTNTVSWLGIELSAMLYYQYGFQIYATNANVNDGFAPYANQSKQALNHWQSGGLIPGNVIINPKPVLNNTLNANANRSTRYLYDGDNLRLQNVSISYQFSSFITNKLSMSSLKIYVQGNNLMIWTKKNNADPNSSSAYGTLEYAYPIQRTFSIGLNANF